jgi:multiple sugar transport system substrate-binding protein
VANWGGASDDSEFARLVQRLYRGFESENPGVRLQVEKIPGSQEYATKLVFAHVSGSMPEAPTLDASSAAPFIEHGILADLSGRMASGPREEEFWPNVVDMFRRGTAVYAVPIDFTPVVLYYNRAHFREAGIRPPDTAWDLADFVAAARELTRDGRSGLDMPNWMPGWIPWVWNHGADVLDPSGSKATGHLDSPATLEALTYMADLVLRHKVAPSLSEMAAAGVDYFASGRASMMLSGHWELVGLQSASGVAMEDVGVMPVPGRVRGQSVTVMYGAGLSLAAASKEPEAAWEFVRYWTSRRVQSAYNSSGIAVCGRLDVASEAVQAVPRYPRPEGGTRAATVAEQEAHRQREEAFLRIVPTARAPWGTRVAKYAAIEQIGQRMMDAVLRNGVDPERAARAAAAEADRVLEAG